MMTDLNGKQNNPGNRREAKGGKLLPALCGMVGTLMILAVVIVMLPVTLPSLLGYQVYTVVSGSMEPEIPIGSIVYVKSAEPEEIEEGDIIAFNTPGAVVMHRVVENNGDTASFVTKGDANDTNDVNEVAYASLLGRVVRHFPVLGRVLALYTSTYGKLYLLAMILAGGLLDVIANIAR